MRPDCVWLYWYLVGLSVDSYIAHMFVPINYTSNCNNVNTVNVDMLREVFILRLPLSVEQCTRSDLAVTIAPPTPAPRSLRTPRPSHNRLPLPFDRL
jgi:hypothetical protein